MNIKKLHRTLLCTLAVIVCSSVTLHAKDYKYSFAIVVDEHSAREARTELQQYAKAIEERNGLSVETIVDRWGIPDSIRKVLSDKYKQKTAPLCGVVFVGDIPIPMIRDAQHLTSAFKMDQQINRQESSVPSDRYYDDFDLQFDYQGHDVNTPFFYYSLRSDSPQALHSNIFSGRIRPTDANGTSRYVKLKAYLLKAVQAKYETNYLDQMFYFTGNGSLNESRVAAIDEKLVYYEHFPWLSSTKQCISYMDHSQNKSIKTLLMNEMMRPELDFGVLHHHGDFDTQYLNSTQLPKTIDEAKAFISYRLRQLAQRKKSHNQDSVWRVLTQKYNVPSTWMNEALSDTTLQEDSLLEASLNLHVNDFRDYGYKPSCRLVILDACFNAAFQHDNSIANAYIFSEGKTLAVIGGSVNQIQDKWYDKLSGLMGLGVYAGYLNMFQNYLESHLIGDPTFCFTPSVPVAGINNAIASMARGNKASIRYKGNDVSDIEVLRLEMKFRSGEISSKELLNMLSHSPYSQVRMQALHLLSECKGDDFVKGIQIAASDRTEMVQRFAVNYMRSSGDPRLVSSLIRLYLQNNTSERVAFNIERAIMYFPKQLLVDEFERQFPEHHYIGSTEVKAEKLRFLQQQGNRWEKEVDNLVGTELKDSSFDFIASCMRLYCPHNRVPDLISYIMTCNNPVRQVRLIEALGWMNLSYQAPLIAESMQQIYSSSAFANEVKDEAQKTLHRVK